MTNNYEPCLPLLSILTARSSLLKQAMERVQRQWPRLVTHAPPTVFHHTRYYEDEMGYPLFRWWGYRKFLADPSNLREWKNQCHQLERDLRDGLGNRTVNLDPGYLNYTLVVLGSHKYDQQKIYLGEGVYADPVLQYGEGTYQPFPWSFPDFKESTFYPTLEEFRSRYKQLRRVGGSGSGR